MTRRLARRLTVVLSRLARSRQAPEVIHRVAWNARQGRRPGVVLRELASFLRGREPHMITLFEAGGYVRAVRQAYRRRYRVLVKHGWAESDTTVTLVRRDVPLARFAVLRMRTSWVGPKAFRRHPGRTHHVLDLGRGRAGRVPLWRYVIVHRVPGGPTGGVATKGRNQPAYAEEHEVLRDLGRRRSSRKRALVCDGDQNAEINDGHAISPATLADELDADLVRTGAKVDWAFTRGCTGHGRKHHIGGDHPLIKYRYEHNIRRNR